MESNTNLLDRTDKKMLKVIEDRNKRGKLAQSKKMAVELGYTQRAIQKRLKRLEELGLVARKGERRGWYLPFYENLTHYRGDTMRLIDLRIGDWFQFEKSNFTYRLKQNPVLEDGYVAARVLVYDGETELGIVYMKFKNRPVQLWLDIQNLQAYIVKKENR